MSRLSWVICLIGIIALGILSRIVHTQLVLVDKYLGDVLYAAMVYAILRLVWSTAALPIYAMGVMTVIEIFQLTMIPAHMLISGPWIVRIFARLLGTEFSYMDLLAYAVGIACIYVADLAGARSQDARGSGPRQVVK